MSKLQYSNRKYNLMIVILVLLALLAGMLFKSNSVEKQAEISFALAIAHASSGLNMNYSKLSEQDRIVLYSRTITSLATAKDLVPFTKFKNNTNYSHAIERLFQFLVRNYSSGFMFELGIQIELYSPLAQIGLNPTDENTINNLDKFITSMEYF